jgi:hypothetical protein
MDQEEALAVKVEAQVEKGVLGEKVAVETKPRSRTEMVPGIRNKTKKGTETKPRTRNRIKKKMEAAIVQDHATAQGIRSRIKMEPRTRSKMADVIVIAQEMEHKIKNRTRMEPRIRSQMVVVIVTVQGIKIRMVVAMVMDQEIKTKNKMVPVIAMVPGTRIKSRIVGEMDPVNTMRVKTVNAIKPKIKNKNKRAKITALADVDAACISTNGMGKMGFVYPNMKEMVMEMVVNGGTDIRTRYRKEQRMAPS